MRKEIYFFVALLVLGFSSCQSAPQQQQQQTQQALSESGARKISSSDDEYQKELAAEKRECKYGEKKNEGGDCVRIDSFSRPFRKNGR